MVVAQLVEWSLPIAGDRSPLWTQIQIQIWKGLAPVSFWSCGVSLSSRVYKMKVVVSVLNRYFLSIGHDHRDRALAWRGPLDPGRLMSGYPNMLKSSH